MRYYFVICAIILSFSSVVKASECIVLQKEISVIISPTVLEKNVFLNQKVNSLSLLDKVFIITHPGKQGVFWKGVKTIFQKVVTVCSNLGSYFYASIFSIFGKV
ncbi:hypothetical protein [Bartonella florencae]|uniref:hypothetical protein n=1 Tax=Bartonella florencae TaxID=928210 RepID=UPI001FED7A1C|nr:hypothetical protein [Bartonella florencae]